MSEQKQYRRWYDKDPILREALELLKLQSDTGNSDDATSEFIIKLQQEVAKDVIDSVYNMVTKPMSSACSASSTDAHCREGGSGCILTTLPPRRCSLPRTSTSDRVPAMLRPRMPARP